MTRFRGCFSVRVSTCLIIFKLCGRIIGAPNEPVKVVVKEGSDAILPCSLSTNENIEFKRFDWKKDGQKEVFLFNAGLHYNNQPLNIQDPQFKGRVFHFQDELQHGNASIIIRNTTAADSGNYTCDFTRLQLRQTFHIELVVVVDDILRDRSEENMSGAAKELSIKTLDETNDWSLLQCVVRGVSPKPTVEWKDSSGNIVPAEEPKITDRGGSYDIILNTAVTKTDRYRCVVTQKEIKHQIHAETFVHISEKNIQGPPTGWIVAAVLSILLNVVLVLVLLRKRFCEKGHQRHENDTGKLPVYDHEQGICLRTEPPAGSDVPAQTSPV